MKALALKELREILGIAAIALAVYLALVFNLMGAKLFDWVPGIPSGTNEVPFTGAESALFFVFVTSVLAVALGVRQTAWESFRGTLLFLFHRPTSRDAIVLTKLATGAAVLVFCAGVPIVIYAWWAAIPGHHASPFEWSMASTAWRMIPLGLLLYVGSFLSGIRPGRWFGTRLLPLVAAVVLVIAICNLPSWSVGLSLAMTLGGLMVVNVCWVARVRDYA